MIDKRACAQPGAIGTQGPARYTRRSRAYGPRLLGPTGGVSAHALRESLPTHLLGGPLRSPRLPGHAPFLRCSRLALFLVLLRLLFPRVVFSLCLRWSASRPKPRSRTHLPPRRPVPCPPSPALVLQSADRQVGPPPVPSPARVRSR